MLNESEYQAFLAAIRAAPGDDLPRLIFADYLDEHGEPDRAAFIRVQCELARHPICPRTFHHPVEYQRRHPHIRHIIARGSKPKEPCGICPVCILRRREGVLFAHLPPLLPREVDAYLTLTTGHVGGRPIGLLRRGFIDTLTLSWDHCRDHLHAVLRREPVRHVTLTDEPEVDGEYSGGTLFAVLVGCDGDGMEFPQATPNREVTLALLRAEWPEVAEWELPLWRPYEGTVIAEISRDFDWVRREGRA